MRNRQQQRQAEVVLLFNRHSQQQPRSGDDTYYYTHILALLLLVARLCVLRRPRPRCRASPQRTAFRARSSTFSSTRACHLCTSTRRRRSRRRRERARRTTGCVWSWRPDVGVPLLRSAATRANPMHALLLRRAGALTARGGGVRHRAARGRCATCREARSRRSRRPASPT